MLFVVLGSAVLGALVGVLVPWAAYRLSVPYGEPARAECPNCAGPLAGWVRVPSRCPSCGIGLGPRAWLWPLVGALVFGGLSWALGPVPALPAFLWVAAISLLLAPTDFACLRLPDPLVASAFGGAAVLLTGAAVIDGRYGPLLRALIAGALLALIYLVLALLPGASLGLGDVKLMGVLGLLLGWLNWGTVVLGAVLPHLINAPVLVVLLLAGKVGRKTKVPLGPALLAGSFLAVVLVAGWRRWLAR